MIVNPQFFNYRIIIGSLVVTIATLGAFGFSNYESFKSEQDFLKKEKKLVETELSQMLLRYDSLFQNSQLICLELDNTKKIYDDTQEELRLLKGDISVLKGYKSKVSASQAKTNSLFIKMDSLYHKNVQLELEKRRMDQNLAEQKQLTVILQNDNSALDNLLSKGALITANSLSAKTYKLEHDLVATTKAVSTNRIDVNFTLAKNTLAEKGLKEIYIQILNPLNNVIGKKSSVEFGNSLLIYSAKQIVNYNNEALDFSTKIMAQKNDIPFAKGTYYVSVFLKDRKLGDTQFVLN